jgi:hypothetical protein
LENLEARLARWPRGVFILGGTPVVLGVAVFCFSPHLNMLLDMRPDTYEWSRAGAYLAQCANPFTEDVEPAMRWRLLPPLVAHAMGLRGHLPLAIPWIGVVTLVGACLAWGEAWLRSRTSAMAFAVVVATTSAVIVPLAWAGMNDAWVWLGLLGITLSGGRIGPAIACLLCPWVDERFIVGLLLAVWARSRLHPGSSFLREMLRHGAFLLPYAAIRGYPTLAHGDPTSGAFLANVLHEFPTVMLRAHLGWWMGLRAGWVLVAWSAVGAARQGRLPGELALGCATVAVSTFLAHDLSRSIAVVVPLLASGAVELARERPERAASWLFGLAGLNLLLPAAHVVLADVDVIHPLPVELLRLLLFR